MSSELRNLFVTRPQAEVQQPDEVKMTNRDEKSLCRKKVPLAPGRASSHAVICSSTNSLSALVFGLPKVFFFFLSLPVRLEFSYQIRRLAAAAVKGFFAPNRTQWSVRSCHQLQKRSWSLRTATIELYHSKTLRNFCYAAVERLSIDSRLIRLRV